ncbi:DUF222 domain-containing protein [Microbacteriaceae bacterium VKM Ac-2854]|nr:DUF222 domain-containing protein [Microbacteriaceae bacterium VKM Ac-2854]
MEPLIDTIWRIASTQLNTPLPAGAASLPGLGDEDALKLVEVLGRIGKAHGVASAAVCAEIARRSMPELGAESLAKRSGAKDAVELIAGMTGASKKETAGAIEVGTLLAMSSDEPTLADPLGEACRGGAFCACASGWNAAISRFVEGGLLSAAGAAAIIRGIGAPTRDVTGHALAGAIRELLLQVRDRGAMTPEMLVKEAKYRRDGLDRTLVLSRERLALSRRALTIGPAEDGMHRVSGFLTADVAENLRTLCDGVVAAALRQPRFTDGDTAAEDAPTVPQLWHDALGAALRVAVTTDKDALPRQGAPVAVIIRATELHPADTAGTTLDDADFDALDQTAADAADDGLGVLGTSRDVVSAAFVRTTACADGIAPITMTDDGVVLNLGRTQRLFSKKQRIALACRDGGCRWLGCDRPASWCDAHHLNEWQRDGGNTDLPDGILLCRAHHLLLHNQHWRITRKGSRYYLYRPRETDPGRRITELPGKNPLHRSISQRDRPTG